MHFFQKGHTGALIKHLQKRPVWGLTWMCALPVNRIFYLTIKKGEGDEKVMLPKDLLKRPDEVYLKGSQPFCLLYCSGRHFLPLPQRSKIKDGISSPKSPMRDLAHKRLYFFPFKDSTDIYTHTHTYTGDFFYHFSSSLTSYVLCSKIIQRSL